MIRLKELKRGPVRGGEVRDGRCMVLWMTPDLHAAASGIVTPALIYAMLNVLLIGGGAEARRDALH